MSNPAEAVEHYSELIEKIDDQYRIAVDEAADAQADWDLGHAGLLPAMEGNMAEREARVMDKLSDLHRRVLITRAAERYLSKRYAALLSLLSASQSLLRSQP